MFSKAKLGLKTLALIGLTFLLSGCASGTLPSFDTVMTNIGNSIAPFWSMVTGGAYLFGFALFMRGMFMLKIYGEMRTMMSGQSNLKGALIYLFVGTVLIFSQTIYSSLLLTTFNATATSPLQYESGTAMSYNAYISLLRFVQLIGLISFIRGWILLTHASNPGQQNTFGKALTHIIGGLLAINIQGTIDVLKGTVGMT